MKRLLTGILVIILCGACAIGPNFKVPETKAPAQWKWQQAADNAPMVRGMYSRWWMAFNDPKLNELEEKALAHNQDLKAAVANVLVARAQARISQADFYPFVTSDPAFQWGEASTKVDTGSPFEIARRTISSYQVPLDISYEVDLWGKIRRHFESERSLAKATQEEYQAFYLSLTSDVAHHYILLRTFDQEREILEKTIRLRKDSVDVNLTRYQAGLISEIDVARARVEMANAQADLADSIRQRRQMENALATLTGALPTDFLVESMPLEPTTVPPKIPPGLPSEILKRRPDVARAEAQLHSENAEIGVALAQFFPVVRLTGTAGFESSDLANPFIWNARTWSIGPSITVPIFEGGRNLANYKASKARYDASLAKYRQQVLVAFREVEDTLVELRQRYEQAQAEHVALETIEEVVTLAHERYNRGITNYLEVIDAERTMLETQLSSNQILGQRLLATVQLVKALGGGWQP